jgi:hypothetical protein
MKKLIHRYLNENYLMIGNRGLFRNTSHSMSLGSPSIIADLKKVFGLTRKELKWYLKSWIRNQNRNFDFNDWWTPPISIFTSWVPIAGRAAIASTISQDLVSVEPMEGPSGQLFYLNYQYAASIDPIETFNPRINVADRYGSATIRENRYEGISVRGHGNIEEDGTVTRMLNDWINLKNEQTQIQHEQ